MPRPRKPDELHLIQGTYRRDRHGDPATKPKYNGPVEGPPDYFDEAQRAAWYELVDNAPEGVLWRSDSPFVELMAVFCAQVRAGTAPSSLERLFHRGLGQMGMTPAGRATLGLPSSRSQRTWRG